MRNFKCIYIIIGFFFHLHGNAQQLLNSIEPKVGVNDLAELFSLEEKKTLDAQLEDLYSVHMLKMFIITLPSLESKEPFEMANVILDQWSVADSLPLKMVLLIKPKNEKSKGKVFLAVSKPLQSTFNFNKRIEIVQSFIIPAFKQNRMFEGVYTGIEELEIEIGKNNHGKQNLLTIAQWWGSLGLIVVLCGWWIFKRN